MKEIVFVFLIIVSVIFFLDVVPLTIPAPNLSNWQCKGVADECQLLYCSITNHYPTLPANTQIKRLRSLKGAVYFSCKIREMTDEFCQFFLS